MERSTVMAQVLIGDCEGNHPKPMFYIELEDDDYVVAAKGDNYTYVHLTDQGLDSFRGKMKWDVDYFNYEIRVYNTEADVQHEYEKLLKQNKELLSKIAFLGKWLGV